MDRTTRILIAGAGPVGLTLAIELKRRGFTPRIIDKAGGPAGESRALALHARTLDILEPACVTEALLNAGQRITGGVFGDQHGIYMQIDFSLIRQPRNYVLMLPQSETERILLGHLHSMDVDVEWNTSLEDFTADEDRFKCKIAGTNQGDDEFDLLVGCDGAHSTVRDILGLGFAGASWDHRWQLADVQFRDERRVDQLRIKSLGTELLAYFPLSPHSGRFVSSQENVLEVVAEEVDIEQVIWESDFRISHRIVDSYQKGNAFLAGDAAHIHSPVGGRGMNLGIEDAATLAWLIETDQAEHYTSMRRPLGLKVLRFTERQTRLIISRNPLIRFMRRRLLPILMTSKTAQRMFFAQISGANTPKPEWL